MDLKLPSSAELQELYDAAAAYGKVAVEALKCWNAVKEEVFAAQGHNNHSIAAPVAYADPKVKRLHKKQDSLLKKANKIRDRIDAKYKGLNLYSPAPFLGWGKPIDNYVRAVRSSLKHYAERAWMRENAEAIEDLRLALRALKPVETIEAGLTVYHRGILYEILKITHKGKRIVAKNLFDGSQQLFRPGVRLELATEDFTFGFIAYRDSRQEFLAECGLADVD